MIFPANKELGQGKTRETRGHWLQQGAMDMSSDEEVTRDFDCEDADEREPARL